MKVWIDLANSPHVPLFVPIVRRLEAEGHEVVLSARDHAQTVALASDAWGDVTVIGSASPAGRASKAMAIAARATSLRRFGDRRRPQVALSHGSYAQVVAARLARIPAVTMMDYEHQPANHLSFRLAHRVIVPQAFPRDALRRFGAHDAKLVTYAGFKEELYLPNRGGDDGVRAALGLQEDAILAVLRPPPEGALYHRGGNNRFEEVLAFLEATTAVELVLLPRSEEQRTRYEGRRLSIPERPVAGAALLATADLVVGAGGTMTREAALLRTPTYTVFMAELAAVDAELIRRGLIVDLRTAGLPRIARKPRPTAGIPAHRAATISDVIVETLEECADEPER